MRAELNRKVHNFAQAARLEQLTSPDIIQKTKAIRHPSSASKIFEVQSEAAGDSIYNCYEQTLNKTEWDDTEGAPKFEDKNEDEVEVLNLAEFDPEATYVAHLAAGDLIAAWRMTDDEGTKRWIGIPFRQHPNIAIKIFEVVTAKGWDGIYNCKEQKLVAAEWPDEEGTSKFDEEDAAIIEVLNLAEFDPEATYVAHLAAGDLIAAWQMFDDGEEETNRWVGVPFRQANADRARKAYCKDNAGAAATITCYLDEDDSDTQIPVECNISGSPKELDKCIRRLKDGDPILVTKIGADWYCTEGFQVIDEDKGLKIIENETSKLTLNVDDEQFEFSAVDKELQTKLYECPEE